MARQFPFVVSVSSCGPGARDDDPQGHARMFMRLLQGALPHDHSAPGGKPFHVPANDFLQNHRHKSDTEAGEDDDEERVCGVCRVNHKRLLLTCSHSFCITCLDQWSTTRGREGKALSCPECRHDVKQEPMDMES